MENHATLKQKIDNLPDRTIALLGLQRSPKTQTTTCPTDAELDDFIQGKLTYHAREQMLIHLDQCSDCYQHWVDKLHEQKTTTTPKAWWHGLGEVLHLNKPWQVSTYFATLVIFVILARAIMPQNSKVNSPEPNIVAGNSATTDNSQSVTSDSNDDDTLNKVALSSSIAMDYKEVISKGVQVSEVHEVLPSSAMSVTAAPSFTNASTAYKTCLDNGFNTLQNKTALITTSDAKYKTVCELAQWVALVSSVLLDNVVTEPAFWQRQLEQSQHFEQYFRTLPKTKISNELQRISQEINLIIDNPTKLNSLSFIDNFRNDLKNLSQSRF